MHTSAVLPHEVKSKSEVALSATTRVCLAILVRLTLLLILFSDIQQILHS